MQRREFLGTTASLACATAFRSMPAHVDTREQALRGRRAIEGAPLERVALDSPFLDAHVHSTSAALLAFRAAASGRATGVAIDGAELIRRMDADGVRRAFVLSTAYQMAADAYGSRTSESAERSRVQLDNDFAAEQCARYPERLVPFLSVNPKRGYAVDEIDRCVEQQKMRGLKLHLWNSLVDTRQPNDLAALKRVVGHAAQRGLPVVAHILVGAVPNYGSDDTERFVREIIEPFDSLKISVAHLAGAGGFGDTEQRCFERLTLLCGPESPLAKRVWSDMAAILMPNTTRAQCARLGELAARWGLERLFWGSDNIDGALREAQATWPLNETAWHSIAVNHGESFCR